MAGRTREQHGYVPPALLLETNIYTPEGLYLDAERQAHTGLFAQQRFEPQTTLFEYSGLIKPGKEANRHAIQIGPNEFLESLHDFANFVRHSCQPNCIIQVEETGLKLVALELILPQTELTYNYNSTEWDMLEQERLTGQACSFSCHCGRRECVGRVEGFSHLTENQQLEVLGLASPYVLSRFLEENRLIYQYLY